MTSQDDRVPRPFPLLPAGWVVAAVVALLAYIAKPDDELGFAIVVGALALSMALWTYRSARRASAVASVVLGVLWTLLFGGYALANFASDGDIDLLIRLADLLAVVGGLMILFGALSRLRGAPAARSV